MRILSIAFSVLVTVMPYGLFAQEQTLFIPGLLKQNNQKAVDSQKADIFYQALMATHLSDSLEMYLDPEYPAPGYDSTYACLEKTGKSAVEYETAYETGSSRQRAVWPDRRYFKFTFFVVPDATLKSVYGINSLEDLRAKAIEVYGGSAGTPDYEKESPLFKLMSYHILPCWLPYNLLNISESAILDNRVQRGYLDEEDFYETMHPYAIMRISTPLDYDLEKYDIYINRKGTVTANNLTHKGVRIWSPNEYGNYVNLAVNGGYHFIDGLLFFDQETKNALRTRLRFMVNTLSPDFINSGARGRLRNSSRPVDYAVFGFKKGFCKNVDWSDETGFFVRYMDKDFSSYNGDEMTIRGNYDITFRLPPVPESGTYEIRVLSNTSTPNSNVIDRGYTLYYIGKEGERLNPIDKPVDYSISIKDPSIGYIKDSELNDEALIEANDKLMHSRGYMKAPDSYKPSSESTSSNSLRDNSSCFRKIICEQYFEAGKDYYLRIRQVGGDYYSVHPFNILEIVPYSVYSGENGPEDRH